MINARLDVGALNAASIPSYLRRNGLTRRPGPGSIRGMPDLVFYCPTTGRVMLRVVRLKAFSDTIAQELNFQPVFNSIMGVQSDCLEAGFEQDEK